MGAGSAQNTCDTCGQTFTRYTDLALHVVTGCVQAEQVCRYFGNCAGCVHCTAPEVCEYCHGDEDEQCDKCGDYFTSCELCGELNIPVDFDGMAGDICDKCGTPPAVEVAQALTVLCADVDRFTGYELDIFAQAVLLLRTHALPESHPWAVK